MEIINDNSVHEAPVVTIGLQNPIELDSKQFSQSNEILFHGTPSDFEYSHTGEYHKKRHNGRFFGKGFYTTNSRQIAEKYSQGKGIVKEFLPYDAKMLNLKDFGNIIPKYIFTEYINTVETYCLNEGLDNTDGHNYLKWLKFLDFISNNFGHKVTLAEMLKTGIIFSDDYLQYGENIKTMSLEAGANCYEETPGIDIMSGILRKFQIDGIIIYDPMDTNSPIDTRRIYYIFYNLAVIGTFESWKNQSKTQKKIENILNPPLA